MSQVEVNKNWQKKVYTEKSGAIINCTWPGKKSYTQKDEYLSENAILDGIVDRYETLLEGSERGFDNVPVCAVLGGVAYLVSSAYGCPIHFQNELTVTRPLYKTPDEIKHFEYIENAYERGYYEIIFETIEKINERYPEIPLSVSDTQSPIDIFTQFMSVEDSILLMIDDPELAHAVLDGVTQSVIDINRQFEKKIKNFAGFASSSYLPYGIHVSDDNAAFLSPDIYREFAMPYADRLSKEFGGIFLHVCMKFEQNLKNLAAIDGFIGFDAMPYYNDPHKILAALGEHKVWNVYDYSHSRPPYETEPAEDYYRRLIDVNENRNAMRFDILKRDRDEALRLADTVKDYAAKKGMKVKG